MEGLPPVDFRGELNDEQYAAVTSPRGPALVLAGAGSGKTRTLTYRVAWLLHQGAKPWDILLLTFTNKSAKEMLERVEDLTGVPRGQFWGGTFHSIGQRILRRNAAVASRSPDFTILDQKESEQLFSEIVKSIDGAFIKDKTNPKASVILDAYSHARNTLRPLQDVLAERLDWMKGGPEKLMQFCTAYAAAKQERNLCDFDDLLSLWLHVLENDPAALAHYRGRFKHILVDEFQDTNRLQSRIIDLLASEHQIMAVGDDAQCIYTWRGADWENIVAFPQRHPGTLIHTIDTNYRSTPEILAFANEILSHRPRVEGFDRRLQAVRPSGPQPTVFTVGDTSQQAKLVVRKLMQLHHEGHALKDMHVLYRAHYQSLELQMELNAMGVPFVITSGHKFFDLAHVKDILAHLRFVHNPLDQVALSRLLCLLPKVGPVAAEKISKAARETEDVQGRGLVRALRADAVLKRVPESAKDDFNDLTITLEDMLEGLEAAKAKPAPTGPAPDLFVGGKGEAQGGAVDLWCGKEVARGGHEDGDTGLVIGSEQRGARGGHDIMANFLGQIGEFVGREREVGGVWEGDGPPIIAFDHPRFNACGVELGRGVDMGEKAYRGAGRGAGNGGKHGAIVGQGDIGGAHLFQFGFEQVENVILAGGRWGAGAVGIGLAVDRGVAAKTGFKLGVKV